MDIKIAISQSPSTSQQLNLAPQLLWWLKILQAPSAQLEQYIRSELEKNPALELDPGTPAPSEALPDIDPAQTDFKDSDFGEKLEVLASIDDDWKAEGNRTCGGTPDEESENTTT
jgi:RNA polymerase sigma-54 factor